MQTLFCPEIEAHAKITAKHLCVNGFGSISGRIYRVEKDDLKKYASRGGLKLEFATKEFGLNVTDKTCADFGSSAGGFVDCLLSHGAKKVYAVETGYGLLDWRLRNDKRVVVMERQNAMHVGLPEKADLITVDTSWTKQQNVLPSASKNLKGDGLIVSLIKPSYEYPNKKDDERKDEQLIFTDFESMLKGIGLKLLKWSKSPIEGAKRGDTEYLALIQPA